MSTIRNISIIALIFVSPWFWGCEYQTEPVDCAGVPNGTAYVDECGNCVDSREKEDCNDEIDFSIILQNYSGTISNWYGYDMYTFEYDGRDCGVVSPSCPAEGNPWIWMAKFGDPGLLDFAAPPHKSFTDIDLYFLEKGFYLVYMNVNNMYGSPTAVEHWNNYYDFVTQNLGLSQKAILQGISRWGLIIYNWAIANPYKVSSIYGDNAVFDFKSWPGPLGGHDINNSHWIQCKAAYGFTSDEEALNYDGNPIDNLDKLVEADVPLINGVAYGDESVPMEQNALLAKERYSNMGGNMVIIMKSQSGHWATLLNLCPVINFIIENNIH